jgi:prolyl-tRNA editing enzyme YbaK/EbsC (Cys-tRNA(Pro) deacylase)
MLLSQMSQPVKPSAQRVQDALRALGLLNQVLELPDATRTSAEAATAVGCAVGQIAKSLVFRGQTSGKAILVIASGANRVNEKLIGARLGENLQRADPEFVREQTGFVIGGVPPLGHQQFLPSFIDQDLWQYTEIWAAAGHPNAVFKLTPDELARMTGGEVMTIK